VTEAKPDDLFYVLSVHHTLREDLYITVWGPNDSGYRWALSRSGKYTRERIESKLGYYNSGDCNVAVPCAVLDAIAVAPKPGHHDNDAGPVVQNNKANWNLIKANVIRPPKQLMQPQYKGARRIKDAEYA
jgi:hypothetical protein